MGTWATIQRQPGDGFTFNISTDTEYPLYIEGSGQGEDAYTRAACMAILAFMPSEGLEEMVDTMKDIYHFYAYPPDRVLPLPQVVDITVRASSIE